jgi:hypothetical protein
MFYDIRMIPIASCITWAHNPSSRVANTPLWQEFVEHIRRWGQLMPIVVTVEPDGRYRVVDGHRRIAALLQLGYTSVMALICPWPFEVAIEAFGLAEQLKLPWTGRQLGEIVRRLGYAVARAMLRPRYRAILARAYEQIHEPTLVDRALDRWGPRALQIALRFSAWKKDGTDGQAWPLDRVLTAMLLHGEIRDLEDRLKGLRGPERRAAGLRLLGSWEEARQLTGQREGG